MDSNIETQDVSCAVIVRHGMVLAANRGTTVSHSGSWEFPGGKPHEGETPVECVVRRVNEELKIKIEVVDKIEPFEVSLPNESRRFRMHPFLAHIVDGKVELSHHSKAEWFLPMQLMALAWPETDLPIVEEVVGRIFRTGKIV